MAYTDYLDTVQDIYIAYYQRPADPAGLLYWAGRLDGAGGNLNEIIDAFANSAEAKALYGPVNSSTIGNIIDSIYMAMFGRAPDAAGKAYYVDGFNNGTFTAGNIALQILNGAQGDDKVAISDKLAAANEFTRTIDPDLNGSDFQATYSGDADAAAARGWLAMVTSNPATIPTQGQTTTFIQDNIANPGDPILFPHTISLTPGPDIINVTDSFKTLVSGVVGTSNNATFTPGDIINGNGLTDLRLVVTSSTTAVAETLSKISAVDLVAGGDWTVHLNAVMWSDVGSIDLVSGVDGLDARVDALQDGVNLSIASGVSGSLDAHYVSGNEAYLYAGHASSMNFVDGAVTAAVAAGESATFEYTNSANSSGGSFNLGDITLAGAAASEEYVEIYNYGSKPGDITVGNISMTGADSVYLTVERYATSTKAAAGNVTVGDVTLQANTYMDVYFTNEGAGQVGDMTIGNIDASVGQSATGYLYVSHYAYATGAGKDATVGNTTLGNVTVDVGASASFYEFSLTAEAYASAGNATVGDLTVGNVDLSLGKSATFEYFSLSHSAYANGAGKDATVGNATLGDVAIDVGANGYFYEFYVENYAYASSGNATAGDMSIGNVDISVAQGGSIDYFSVTNEASAHGAGKNATVGNTTIGDITVNLATSATLDGFELSVSAYAHTGIATVGDVSVGSLTANVGVNGYFYGYLTVEASGTSTKSSIGNITVGDVNASVNDGGTFEYYPVYAYVPTGDIGDVTVGNITASAGRSAYAENWLDLYATNGSIGTVSVGDVSLTARDFDAYCSFTAYASAANGVGTMSFGNFDLSVNTVASTVAGYAEDYVELYNSGDMKLGDINVSTSSLNAGATDLSTVTVDFNASATGALTLGNITVSGGDGKIDNFATLTSWLHVSAGAGAVTIGNVDYSGYGAAATIDVSGYKGAGKIIGSAKDDVITDNKGTNLITGGAGADIFNFVQTNTGKTEATIDQILDFSDLQGDKIGLGFAVNTGNFSEGTNTSFTDFLNTANAANKAVYVGEVSGNAFMAVDYNADGTVDYAVELAGVSNLNQIGVSTFV
jgi:hypothetical protein